MAWNYRIIAEVKPEGGFTFSIREVYYEKGKPTSWSAEPDPITGEHPMELAMQLGHMVHAVAKTVLVVQGDQLVELVNNPMLVENDNFTITNE